MAKQDDLHTELARLELQLAQARLLAAEYLAILHKREEELDKSRALLEAFATWEPVVSSESQKVICACCGGTDHDEQGKQLEAVKHVPSCPWVLTCVFLGKVDIVSE
jgi:hypothetical protein